MFSTPFLVFARLIAALRLIGTWGANRTVALLGPVRRVLSVGFFTQLVPRLWSIVKTHGPNAATVATLWYTFKGELLSAEDAFKLAKEKGVDELMKGHDPAGVLLKIVDSIPDVPQEHKDVLKRALVEGLHDSPRSNAAPKAPAQQTGIVPASPGVVVSNNNVDAAIAARVSQVGNSPAQGTVWRSGSSTVSALPVAPQTARAQYMIEIREFDRACSRFAIAHNVPAPKEFLRDIHGMYLRFGDLINAKE
jgi:hypothetical protein